MLLTFTDAVRSMFVIMNLLTDNVDVLQNNLVETLNTIFKLNFLSENKNVLSLLLKKDID
jgi:hypothetical protein